MIRVAWNRKYAHPLPDNHRFPMEKYQLVPEQLEHEGTVDADAFFSPEPLCESQILSIHEAEYWRRLKGLELSRQEERKTGFPHSHALIDREVMIMGGTLQCARYALENGVALNVAGGTHHAYANRGEGFCLLNDLALAAQVLLDEGKVQRALVVDLDVHQGNGTAKIFHGRPEVFTFSMHGAGNYPMHKESSDLDVPLADGIDDRSYLNLLRENLPLIMDQSEPDLVLYQCGVDILDTDKLGRLGVTEDGCRERDRMVFEACHRNEVPVVCAMGGGYSPEIWNIVEAHCHTFRLAAEFWG
jgi:acetoin utilization deacetylase AcuC-like enzyme